MAMHDVEQANGTHGDTPPPSGMTDRWPTPALRQATPFWSA